MKRGKMKGIYRKAVFIVTYLTKGNKILYLILKRKLHWKGWEFPKGGMKNRENLIQAVKRELMEETGQKPVKITKFNISGKYNYDKLYRDRQGIIGQTFSLFSAELKNKKIRLDKLEHSAYKWLEYKKAFKLLTWLNQKECLKKVDEYLNKNRKKIYNR